MIICSKVKGLLYELEASPEPPDSSTQQAKLTEFIHTLHHNCNLKPPRTAPRSPAHLTRYPTHTDGTPIAFSPLEDEAAFLDTFEAHGIIVGKQVLAPSLCHKAVMRLHEWAQQLSHGAMHLNAPESWGDMPTDAHGSALLSRGFFEIYHDAIWAEIRQSLRLYLHHVVLWGRADLWTSFDRFGIKLPHHQDGRALQLHVDQNPRVHAGFKTIQGVLALADNPIEQGVFRGVPGSKSLFSEYASLAQNKGEYVELAQGCALEAQLSPHQQAFPLKAGDIVTWDSRTTHANTSNISEQLRFVALIAAGPAPQRNNALEAVRRNAFETGLGSNVREALMHASMKPRFTDSAQVNQYRQPEQLSKLGRLLYGFEPYTF